MTAPTAPPSALADRLAAYRAARERGTRWLLGHMNGDGSIGDPSTGFSYYRAPWTFSVVGETEAASAISGWIRRNLVTPDGRIDGPFRVFDEWAIYRDATLVVGAHAAMQYDLSLGLWPGLLAIRDDASGIWPHDRLPGAGEPRYSDVLDVTAGGAGVGFAALAVGDLAAARGVAGLLARMWDEQPDPERRQYVAWSRTRQRLITEADPEFNAETMLVDNALGASQYWFWGGIAAAFLCRLYLADRNPTHLDLARRYQAFSMAATDAQFDYPAVCKSSWGASLLWQVTGEPEYRDWTLRMGDWYVDTQEPEGWWHPLVEQTLGDVIEITLEFVMHLDTLIGGLSSRH